MSTNSTPRGEAQDLEVLVEQAAAAAITLSEAGHLEWASKAVEDIRDNGYKLHQLLCSHPHNRDVKASFEAALMREFDAQQAYNEASLNAAEYAANPYN